MSDQRSAKGNPAHKRMGNAQAKAKRARSYARGLQRKAERQKAQEAAASHNREAPMAGRMTPWERACAARAARRAGLGGSQRAAA